MRIAHKKGKGIISAATATFVRLTNGTIEALLSAANAARADTDVVLEVQHLDADGKVQPAGADAASAAFVQGANYAEPSAATVFGDPAAVPAHSTAFAGNVLEAAAQAEAVALAVPATGKEWQTLQIQLRWTVVPPAPVAGTPDLFIAIYWQVGAEWHRIYWPAKHLTDTDSVDDMRQFSDFTSLDFPLGATAFAVGVAGYVGGELFVDMRAKA